MKHLRLFKNEAEYNAATLDLPVVSYVKDTGAVHYDGRHAVDRAINAPLMNLLVANEWAKESENYLTYDEAALVTSINKEDLVTYNVTRLIEMKYFTAVTSINLNETPVESFYLNSNCAATFNNSGNRSNIKYLKLADDIVSTHQDYSPYAAINQYTNFYNSNQSTFTSGTIYVAGKNTKHSGTKYGGWITGVETVVLPCEEVLATGSGIIVKSAGTIYVPDNLVDGYKEAYSTYASKFVPLSQFDDPYPDY